MILICMGYGIRGTLIQPMHLYAYPSPLSCTTAAFLLIILLILTTAILGWIKSCPNPHAQLYRCLCSWLWKLSQWMLTIFYPLCLNCEYTNDQWPAILFHFPPNLLTAKSFHQHGCYVYGWHFLFWPVKHSIMVTLVLVWQAYNPWINVFLWLFWTKMFG